MGAARCYASTAAATGRSGRVMRWASSPCRATQCTVATLTTMHIAAVLYQIQRRHQRRGTLQAANSIACLLSVAKVVAHLQRGLLHTGAICSRRTHPRRRAPPSELRLCSSLLSVARTKLPAAAELGSQEIRPHLKRAGPRILCIHSLGLRNSRRRVMVDTPAAPLAVKRLGAPSALRNDGNLVWKPSYRFGRRNLEWKP
jgi:hypothetical protein